MNPDAETSCIPGSACGVPTFPVACPPTGGYRHRRRQRRLGTTRLAPSCWLTPRAHGVGSSSALSGLHCPAGTDGRSGRPASTVRVWAEVGQVDRHPTEPRRSVHSSTRTRGPCKASTAVTTVPRDADRAPWVRDPVVEVLLSRLGWGAMRVIGLPRRDGECRRPRDGIWSSARRRSIGRHAPAAGRSQPLRRPARQQRLDPPPLSTSRRNTSTDDPMPLGKRPRCLARIRT